MRKGQFDLNDLREQLIGMQQMGGMSGLMGMLPGVAKMKNQLAAANLDERLLKRQMAAIDSMTPKERRNPDVLKASRKKRIAAGSGVKVEDINRMLKMHRHMADVMKMMGSRQARPDGRPRQHARARRRHADADAGADGGAGEEDAGRRRRGRRTCRRRMPGAAAEIPRHAVRCCPGLAAPSRGSAASPDWGRRNDAQFTHGRHSSDG